MYTHTTPYQPSAQDVQGLLTPYVSVTRWEYAVAVPVVQDEAARVQHVHRVQLVRHHHETGAQVLAGLLGPGLE